MDGLDKIFESLDDKIFTTNLKLKLKQQFNEAVERKSDEVVDTRLEEELERLNEKSNEHIEKLDEAHEVKLGKLNEEAEEQSDEYEAKLSELSVKADEHFDMLNEKYEECIVLLNEKSEEHIDMLNEKAEEFAKIKAEEISDELVESRLVELEDKSNEYVDFLNEKAEEFVEIQREKLADLVSNYMDRVVEEFVSETTDTLAESVKSNHADMLIEAFDSMIVAGGVDIADIVESREVQGASSLEESNRKYDRLVNENIALVEQNEKLINMGVISEVKEGLSLVESDKFESLAKLVEFSKTGEYLKKLETIRESVTGAKAQESVPTLRTLKVSKESKELNENVSGELICSHLL